MASCPWYVRWLHRAYRKSDRQFMVPAIIRAASNSNVKMATEVRANRAKMAFIRFSEQRGQEHWLCPCGAREYAEILKTLEPTHAPD